MENTDSAAGPAAQAAAPAASGGLGADLLGALECLLFAAADPLTPAELAEMLEVEPARVAELATELASRCAGRGLQIVQVAGGYQMCTRPEYGRFIARLHEPERFRLSRAALETLAIVAYRQPVTRPEIEAIRGVNVDGVISTLLQYRLIRECGRKDAPGRPMLYGTTEDFLQHFGLNTVRDLPELDTLPVDESAVLAEESAAGTENQTNVGQAPSPVIPAQTQPGAAVPHLEREAENQAAGGGE